MYICRVIQTIKKLKHGNGKNQINTPYINRGMGKKSNSSSQQWRLRLLTWNQRNYLRTSKRIKTMAVRRARKISTINVALSIREMPVNSILVFTDLEATNQTVRTTVLREMEKSEKVYTTARLSSATKVLRVS